MTDAVDVSGSRLRSGATIQVAGFKHLAVMAIAAAVAIDGKVRLANVPLVADVRIMCLILARMGAQVERRGNQLELDCRTLRSPVIPVDLMAQIHGALYLIPALLARLGTVRFGSAGGCRIGSHGDGERPVHHLLDVLRRFGAVFVEDGDETVGTVHALTAAEIDIADWSSDPYGIEGPLVSGATKAAIISGILARGTTVIHHPYLRAEITELIALLIHLGVAISVTDGVILIAGHVRNDDPAPFFLMPDLIEVVTYCACAVHGGITLRIDGLAVAKVRHGLAAEFSLMAAMGIDLRWTERSLSISRPGVLEPFDTVADADGIYSDGHPFFALMALHARSTSRIRDRIWTKRFRYVPELVKLGARMTVAGDGVFIVPGPLDRGGRTVVGTDVRAAAVLAIAALTIPGSTRLHGVGHLARGYQDLFAKLRQFGADINPLPASTPATVCEH